MQKKISRNTVMKYVCSWIFTLFLAFPFCVWALSHGEKIILRVSVPSKEGSSNAQIIENLGRALEERSPHTFEVKKLLLGKGALPQGTELKAMKAGEIEIAFLSPVDLYNASKEHKEARSFNGVEKKVFENAVGIQMMPFLMQNKAHMEVTLRVLNGAVASGMEGLGGISLGTFYHGRRVVSIATSKPINRPQEIDKLRVPEGELWEMVAQSLETSSFVTLPREEVEKAIKRGDIKAIELPLASFEETGLFSFFPQIIETNHLYHYLYLTIAKDTWKNMTEKHRQVLMEAAKEAIKINNVARVKKEEQVLQEYKTQKIIIPHADLDMKAFQDQTVKVFALKLKDPSFKNLYEIIKTLK